MPVPKNEKSKVAARTSLARKDSNANLTDARKNKNDEFYTQLSDIEKELAHYKEHFRGKTIFCNCDDPEWSNFWKFFTMNFQHLGLKKVISTHYERDARSYKLEFSGDGAIVKTALNGDGDFRSDECVAILKEADIVVTNPPFSLFREYVAQLENYGKRFLIIGNINATTYKELFTMFMENRIWLGQSIHSGDREFRVPEHYPLEASGIRVDESGNKFIRVKGVRWLTNLDYPKRHEDLILFKTYIGNEADYPKYDSSDVINIDKVKDIPCDYDEVMGVPITFLDKFNPEQFELLGIANSARWIGYECLTLLNKKKVYNRLMIRRRADRED